MKKTAAALLAALLILAVSGCGDNPTEQSQSSGQGGTVSQVVFGGEKEQLPDTTAEALEYLSGQIPLTVEHYFRIRTQTPMTYETTQVRDGETYVISSYVKDDEHCARYMHYPTGAAVRELYTVDRGYLIDDEARAAYLQEVGAETVQKSCYNLLIHIQLVDAQDASYDSGEATFEGTMYKYERISTDTTDTVYYFDMDTEELIYMTENGVAVHIDKLENSVPADMFTIPDDYEMLSIDDYGKQ